MYQGKIIFSQIMDHLPIHTFRRKVQQYQGNRYVKNFCCLDQYLCMAFANSLFEKACVMKQALPHGNSWKDLTKHTGRCQ